MKKGFSLIETLVVIASFAIIVGTLVGVFTMVTKNNRKSEAILNLRQQGDNIIFGLSRKIMTGMSFGTSDCNENPARGGVSANPVIINFYGSNGNVIQETLICTNGVLNDPNNGDIKIGIDPDDYKSYFNSNLGIDIQSCTITCYNKSNKKSVYISFDLNNGVDAFETFATHIVMRNAQ